MKPEDGRRVRDNMGKRYPVAGLSPAVMTASLAALVRPCVPRGLLRLGGCALKGNHSNLRAAGSRKMRQLFSVEREGRRLLSRFQSNSLITGVPEIVARFAGG